MGFCYLPFCMRRFAKYPEVWNLFSLSLHMARTCNQESMVSNSIVRKYSKFNCVKVKRPHNTGELILLKF